MHTENPNMQMTQQTAKTAEEERTLRSLRMLRPGPGPAIFGTILFLTFIVVCFFFLFVPWRQSVAGNGEIIVFAPMNRPQTIEAQIPGRLSKWYVKDGQAVKAGELIAEVTEIDPRFLSLTQLKTLEEQKSALLKKQELVKQRVTALETQVTDQSAAREAAIPAAQERIGQANDRLLAAQQSVEVAEQNVKTTQWQLDRITALYDKGLRSQRDQQLAVLDNTRAKTELQRAKAAYDVVHKDKKIAGLDLKKMAADTQANISAVKAQSADASQVIAATNAEIARIDIDIQNLLERVEQRKIVAPCSGRVVRLNRIGAGETVNAGAILATIAPDTDDRAAAIMIRDFDAPLVQIGDPVRLSISGWPSLQFVGWPSVAFGTFAGKVEVIDAFDDGKHYFRAIVVPDKEAIDSGREQPWPSANTLRPGAQASAWVLLRDVPLWFELWRQFNGFQPTVTRPDSEGLDRGSKAPSGLDRGIKPHGE